MADDKRTYQSGLSVAVSGLKPVSPKSGAKGGDMHSRRIKGGGSKTRSFSRELVLRLIEHMQEK